MTISFQSAFHNWNFFATWHYKCRYFTYDPYETLREGHEYQQKQIFAESEFRPDLWARI